MAVFSVVRFVLVIWTGLALGSINELQNSGNSHYFDPTCNMPTREGDEGHRFPFVIGYQTRGKDPKNLTDNREHDYDHWVKYVHVVVNDTCGTTIYVMVVRRLQSYLQFFDPDHLKPEYGCDPIPNYATHLPSLEVHWNISRAYLNVDDNVPAEWFDWGSPSDARTLMIARVQHVYSATPTVAVNCFVKLESFMISGATLRVYYPGCPEGRYGGQCEHNCSCPDNATCHTLNGACKCPDGWTGQFCDEAAPLTTHEVPMQSTATMEMTTTAKTPSPPPKPLPPPSSSSSRLALKIALPIVLCLVVIVALVVTWWWTYWKKRAAHTKLVYESNPLYDEEGL